MTDEEFAKYTQGLGTKIIEICDSYTADKMPNETDVYRRMISTGPVFLAFLFMMKPILTNGDLGESIKVFMEALSESSSNILGDELYLQFLEMLKPDRVLN